MASPVVKPMQPLSLADTDPADDAAAAEWERQTVVAGHARVLAETERLRSLGILDEKGDLRTNELPSDMRPGSKTDVSTL